MPILSLRIIKHPRISRRCAECSRRLEGETIRLYGMAEYGDKPYSIYLHRKCLFGKDALAKLEAAEHQMQRTHPVAFFARMVTSAGSFAQLAGLLCGRSANSNR